MKTILPLMFLSFIVSGCYSFTLVTPSGEKGDLSYPLFNEKFGNDEADISLRDGQTVSGEGIYISHDTVSWVDPKDHGKLRAPVESVRSIVRVNHTSSAFLGLGIGAAIGVGIALKVVTGDYSDGGGLGLVWVIAPPSAALIGAVFGGLIGSTSLYEFPKDTTSIHSGGNK